MVQDFVRTLRINDDVISTSVCQHPGEYHAYVTSSFCNSTSGKHHSLVYFDESGSFVQKSCDDYYYLEPGWYYIKEVVGGGTAFCKCSGEHAIDISSAPTQNGFEHNTGW